MQPNSGCLLGVAGKRNRSVGVVLRRRGAEGGSNSSDRNEEKSKQVQRVLHGVKVGERGSELKVDA